MPAANNPTEDSREADSFFTIVIAALLSASLPRLGLVPAPEAVLVGWAIAFFVGYFIPPRPQMRFGRWMLERLIVFTCWYLAVFKVPIVLKRSLTPPVAYGIPIMMFVVGFVLWLRHLRNSSRARA